MSSSVAALPSLVQIEAERGRRSLRYFIRHGWGVLEPATDYIHNWHIDVLTEHLEAVSKGEIQDLVINVPPGCMKSLTVCVFWPAWIWAQTPATRFLTTSYKQDLATRDCVKARRLMDSDWYQERWGDAFRFTTDQNEKTRYENDQTGFRVANSIHSVTGERADVVITDDPHNIKKAESPVEREAVVTSWKEVLSQRLTSRQRGARVIIMQRVHQKDLVAEVLKQGGYEHLCLPMEYEGNPCVTVLGPQDRRDEDRELLWPDHFPPKEVAKMQIELGIWGTAAQLQQRPVPRGGGIFQRAWFPDPIPLNAVPREAVRGRYWDKAGVEGGGKFTAGVRMAIYRGIFYIEDVVRGQWAAASREPIIRATAAKDARLYGAEGLVIWLEQEPGSSGKDSVESSIRNLAGYVVEADRPTGDKLVRAGPLASAAQAGNVRIVEGKWNEPFLDELEAAGPTAAYLDQVDAASGAFNKLALNWYGEVEEEVFDPDEVGVFGGM